MSSRVSAPPARGPGARPPGASARRAALLIALLVGASAPVATHGQSRVPPRTTAQTLMDLARDQALRVGEQPGEADVLAIRTLLRAAVRLDPRLRDAWVWLYELTDAGDAAAARTVLEGLLAADPNNEPAFARWLDLGLSQQQANEQQRDWLTGQLSSGRSAALQARIHVELARLALQRIDLTEGRRQLDQALALNRNNLSAALLAIELCDDDTPTPQRLAALLAALRLNPTLVEVAWRLGSLLDDAGLPEDAVEFFRHAQLVNLAADATPLPADKAVRWSLNALARGANAEAAEMAAAALASPTAGIQHLMYQCWLMGKLDRAIDAEQARTALRTQFGQVREPNDWPVTVVAQAAWFHCTLDVQPERALLLAEAASRRAPGDPFATRVLGWAQSLSGKPDEARATLTPIARDDAFAAGLLAQMLKDSGDIPDAVRMIEGIRNPPRVGPAASFIRGLDLPMPGTPLASQPASQAATRPATAALDAEQQALRDALAGFDRGILDLVKDPARFVTAEVVLDEPSLLPGDPWWATFTLRNSSKFPITLGADGVVNPTFLVSFEMEGDRRRDLPNLMTASISRAVLLSPGGTVSLRLTLDVGPLRRASRMTPQQIQRVTLSGILDAQRTGDGGWRPSLTGLRMRPVSFNRLPVQTTPDVLNALFTKLRGESEPARVQAVGVLSELLGEAQRAERERLSYSPTVIPADRVRAALLGALNSDSWELRARTLEALLVCGLDGDFVRAAEACLKHPNWVVRMMALRLLARQGTAFLDTAKRLAADDPDDLVRDLARSYVLRWSASASQPAEP